MTLQSSGQIRKSEIAAEFSVTGGNFRIETFYRGGANVSDIAANIGIPTAGEIKFSDFYGAGVAGGDIIALTGANSVWANPVGSVTVYWKFTTGGAVYYIDDGVEIEWFPWSDDGLGGAVAPSNSYWIRGSYQSGDPTTGGSTLNVWHKISGAGSSNVQFDWTSATTPYLGEIKIEIASDAVGSTIIATDFFIGEINTV